MQRFFKRYGLLIVILIVIIGMTIIFIRSDRPRNAFEYDIEKWKYVDKKLILYSEVDKFDGSFKRPAGIFIDRKDNVYICGDFEVKMFSSNGKMLRAWNMDKPVRCVAVDSAGIVYIGLENQVLKYNKDKLLLKWGRKGNKKGEIGLITAIEVFKNNVFVADYGNRCVHRFDTNGKFINDIARKDLKNNILGLIVPSPYLDISIDSEGFIYIANPGRHKIEKYTFEGKFLKSWGKRGFNIEEFCGCCNPVYFVFTPDRYFVTSEKGISRVKIYDSDGKFKGVVAPPSVFKEIYAKDCKLGGRNIAVDSKGRIYVVDPAEKTIRIFKKKPVQPTRLDR